MIVNMPMKKIAAGSFKVHCLAVMDEVQSKRESVIITRRGKPVAKLVPIDKQTDDIFGFPAGKGEVTGNVVDSRYSVLRSTDRRP
jgi:prevent-host-death family protein